MFTSRRRIVAQIFRCVIVCVLIFFTVQLTILLVGDKDKPAPKLDDLKKLMVRDWKC